VSTDDNPSEPPLVERFVLNPGEIAVISFPGHITKTEADQIKAAWKAKFPENQCVVFSQGGRVTGVQHDEEKGL
jgi:Ni,Fe-hydrogenase III small subunit